MRKIFSIAGAKGILRTLLYSQFLIYFGKTAAPRHLG